MPEQRVIDMVYRDLTARLDKVSQDQKGQIAAVERSETAGGMPQSTLANAPLAVTGNVRSGDMLFITNGRKSGETAGNGTGVPCYYNAPTDQWFTFSSDLAVTI